MRHSNSFNVFLLNALVCVTSACVNPFAGDRPVQTGLKGMTLLEAPCPVIRDDEPCPDQPFSASFTVTTMDSLPVATFSSDAEGHFLIGLAPGRYIIVADASAPFPHPQSQQQVVEVEAGKLTEVTLLFDSGIR